MITVDGKDLTAEAGVRIVDRVLPFVGERSEVVDIPGRIGGVRVAGTVPAAVISCTGHWLAADHAGALASRAALARALGGAPQRVGFSDMQDREWLGYLQTGSSARFWAPQWIAAGGDLNLDWLVPEPTARAVVETALNLAPSTVTGLALGNAPSALRVAVTNGNAAPITRVIIQVRTALNGNVTSFVWDGQILPGGTLVVDAADQYATLAGALANSYTADSVFPVADPRAGAANVIVEALGAAPALIEVRYRRRWW